MGLLQIEVPGAEHVDSTVTIDGASMLPSNMQGTDSVYDNQGGVAPMQVSVSLVVSKPKFCKCRTIYTVEKLLSKVETVLFVSSVLVGGAREAAAGLLARRRHGRGEGSHQQRRPVHHRLVGDVAAASGMFDLNAVMATAVYATVSI